MSRNKVALFGTFIVVAVIAVSIFAPLIAPYNPKETFYLIDKRPSSEHLCGIGLTGYDVLSRMIWGCRTALYVGVVSVLIMAVIGIPIGLLSGYKGGTFDAILMRISDVFLCIPIFLIAMVVVKMLLIVIPRTPLEYVTGLIEFVIIILLGIFGWPQIARVVRQETVKYKEAEFIEAAKAIGLTETKIMFSHILPNAVPQALVALTMNIPLSILWEAGLSFLGLGDPTIVSLGWDISLARFSLPAAWWEALFPGIVLFLIVLGFNLMGDGLNEAFNPRLK